jgi:hypothetical protein
VFLVLIVKSFRLKVVNYFKFGTVKMVCVLVINFILVNISNGLIIQEFSVTDSQASTAHSTLCLLIHGKDSNDSTKSF